MSLAGRLQQRHQSVIAPLGRYGAGIAPSVSIERSALALLMSRGAIAAACLALLFHGLLAAVAARASSADEQGTAVEAMWVWRTDTLLSERAERETFIAEIEELGITDVFLFLPSADYTREETRLDILLAAIDRVGVRAWGMEGWRGYFSDVEGPAGLYAAADALVDYNSRNGVKFAGFHSDVEPHDRQDVGSTRLHNGVPQSQLSAAQRNDRDALLAEWLEIHETLLGKMKAAGLNYSAAIPSWVDDYFGEPILVSFKGERRALIEHLMPLVPHYVIMAYNTRPENVIERIRGEMTYADTLPNAPRIMIGIETHAGAGLGVSYADTPGKNNRRAVMSDLATIRAYGKTRKSFAGVAIHDWAGWRDMEPFGARR